MFKKRKEIELQPPKRTLQQKFLSDVVVKLAPTLQDKMQVLDEFYLWLYDQNLDANSACVLTKYKQHLQRE